MNEDNVIDLEPKKESRFKKYAPAAFWTGIVLMPVVNLGACYFGYRTSLNELEIAKIEYLAQHATQS